ncbi:MAG: vWA domain-containing protein [Erythrobacter sp.]
MSRQSKKVGTLRRLLKDKTANTLALGAAAVLPLVGMIGGGLDMSRAYLVQSRMQQACDAAALAARKELSGDEITGGVIPTEIEGIADDFFQANFADDAYGTQNGEFTLTAGSTTRMDGAASVELPMALMQVFGFDELEIDVTCSADLNLPNIDVMLVLDHSGSMAGARIEALREAVFAFYDEVHAVKPDNARIRLGVVPYSGAVNVGSVLMTENPDWVTDSWTYQSREANTALVQTGNEPGEPTGEEELYSDQFEWIPRDPANRLDNGSPLRWSSNPNHNSFGSDACNAVDGTYTVNGERWVLSNDDYFSNAFSNGNNNWRGGCRARVRKYRDEIGEGAPIFEEQFVNYTYRPIVYDTSTYKTFAQVGAPVGTQGGNVNSTWNGCIEERQTVATADWTSIPDDALDMDINLVPDPTRPETQWKPQWPNVTFARTGTNSQTPDEWTTTTNRSRNGFNCPPESRKLTEYPLQGGSRNAAFESYINGLVPAGGTMHNIGVIWGGRLLTENGLFAADNASAPNGSPISRHLLFMTDGVMGADPRNTTAYGNPNMDGRVLGFKGTDQRWSEDELAAVHNDRLAAICERIKNQNITVWTVAFGLPQNTFTRGCASGDSRAFEAADSDQLAAAFRNIANSIAELRLVN